MLVFIVEDNENVREAAAGYLRLEGYEVFEFGELRPVRKFFNEASASEYPDLIVLDVMLPDGDGFIFAKKLRESADIPIIFMTARDQESDRITGLEIGADDYVVKPFSNRELVLRVKAVLRRSSSGGGAAEEEQKKYLLDGDELIISLVNHLIKFNGRAVKLTAAEWNIVTFLSDRAPQVFSRLQLLEYCLDSTAEGSERTIDTHMKNIRQKFGGSRWFETVRGFGFRFNGIKQ